MVYELGGCLCEKVRYAVTETPIRVSICHCRFCQRGTGAAYGIGPLFTGSALVALVGEPSIYSHRSEGSSKMIDIRFCNTCGTKLYQTYERFPDYLAVYSGTFDNPDWFEISPRTARHIYLQAARHGTVIPAGFDTYDGPSIVDGVTLEPHVFDEHHVI